MGNRNKRTLRKRIARGIRWSISISNLIFAVILILTLTYFIREVGMFASDFISKDLAQQISSPLFIKQMNIKSLNEFNPSSLSWKEWKRDLDIKMRDNLEKPSDKLSGKPLENTLERPLEKEHKITLSYHDEPIPLVNIKIMIKGKEVYTNVNKKNPTPYEEFTSNINQKDPKKHFLLSKIFWKFDDFYTIGKTYEIYDNSVPKKSLGAVTVSIDKDYIFVIFFLILGIIFLISMIALTCARFITSFFVRPIIHPIKRLQTKMDAMANGRIEDALNATITSPKPIQEMEQLAESTNKILLKIKDYAKQLENQNSELEAMATDQFETNENLTRKNNHLQNILDSVGQGFLTFGSDLKIYEECSQQCSHIFGKPAARRFLSELLYSGDREQKEFLDTLFQKLLHEEDEVKLDLYLHLLPEELEIQGRNINLEYKIVSNIKSDHMKSVMVILTDITEKKMLEKKMEEEKNTLKMVVKAVVHHHDFVDCIQSYEAFCTHGAKQIIDSKDTTQEILTELFRYIHNFKGNFSQYDMQNIVSKLHNLENHLSELREGEVQQDKEAISEYLNDLNLIQWVKEDIIILKSYLGNDFLEQKDAITIDKKVLIEVEEKMLKVLPYDEFKLLLPDIRRLRFKSFKELLFSYPDYIEKLAERLGKAVNPLVIEGEDLLVDQDYYRDFTKSLVHVFRNSLDHGIELPEERAIVGKNEIGTIKCIVERINSFIRVSIKDDGRGIDVQAIREKALEKSLMTEEELSRYSDKELSYLIFKEEFSLSTVVTEVSGRGIGLFAVMKELERIGGNVKINPIDGQGTEFVFTLPVYEIGSIPAVSVHNVIHALVNKTSHFVEELIGVSLDGNYNIYESDRVNLNTVSAIINIRGILQGLIIISFNEPLLKQLVSSFILDPIADEEIQVYLEDVAAECSNIILGNSIKNFGEIEDLVTIGTPTIICYKGASIKYSNSTIVSCSLVSGNYEISFSYVSIDKIIPEGI